MDLQDSWSIVLKDFSIFKKKKYIIYSLVIIPLLVGILLPAALELIISRRQITAAGLEVFMGAFSFFWIAIGGAVPNTLSTYSIVGEKVEKSLEPLLATPLTDGELLLGKLLAAFLPAVASVYAGITIYMVLSDLVTQRVIGSFFFPNWDIAVILLLIPLACLLSVEVGIMVSSRVNDIRASQQLGYFSLIPFLGIYVTLEVGLIAYNTTNLLYIAAVILILDAILFYLVRITFRREEILTKWK